jgi:hypothetical protein
MITFQKASVAALLLVVMGLSAWLSRSTQAHECHSSPAYAPGLEDHYHDPVTCRAIPLGTLQVPPDSRPSQQDPARPPSVQPDPRQAPNPSERARPEN